MASPRRSRGQSQRRRPPKTPFPEQEEEEEMQDPEPLWSRDDDDDGIPAVLPRLIVFDLDNTLWTPELYQLRLAGKATPRAGRDIRLFPDARRILTDMVRNPLWKQQNVTLAVASRTNRVKWAHDLLAQFRVAGSSGKDDDKIALEALFDQLEILPQSKLTHFERLQQQLKIPYREMLFLDDNASMNCREVSRLGVLCCHTPRGLTVDLFLGALQRYAALKTADESSWMGEVVTATSLGHSPPPSTDKQSRAGKAVIKTYFPTKRYGFLTELHDDEEEDSSKRSGKRQGDYFFHESHVPAGFQIRIGHVVEFQAQYHSSTGKWAATILSSSSSSSSLRQPPRDSAVEDQVEMPCFSMSQPFTALLLHGVKTVESRQYPMFQHVPPGTRVLVHCARANWPHPNDPVRQLEQMGFSPEERQRVMNLPVGFSRGAIVGVVTIGPSRVVAEASKQDEELQRRVVANATHIGSHCTEMVDATWLKRPVPQRGNRGVYKTFVPQSVLPQQGKRGKEENL